MSAFKFEIIARTGGNIKSFAPYVPSINDAGAVAFQASLASSGSAVLVALGHDVEEIVRSGQAGIAEIVSHPDVDAQGRTSFYARLEGGESAVIRFEHRMPSILAESTGIGPLGPTMNNSGAVAFRADMGGGAGIFVHDGEAREVARVGERFVAFEGLPLMLEDGLAIFRAATADGRQGIYRSDGSAVVEAQELGNFPCINDSGEVAFVEKERGVFVIGRDGTRPVAGPGDGLESFRGALIDGRGNVVFFATPVGGTLGVYSGGERLFGISETLLGENVLDFALNPVSINRQGDLAVRVAFASGEAIVRGTRSGT